MCCSSWHGLPIRNTPLLLGGGGLTRPGQDQADRDIYQDTNILTHNPIFAPAIKISLPSSPLPTEMKFQLSIQYKTIFRLNRVCKCIIRLICFVPPLSANHVYLIFPKQSTPSLTGHHGHSQFDFVTHHFRHIFIPCLIVHFFIYASSQFSI